MGRPLDGGCRRPPALELLAREALAYQHRLVKVFEPGGIVAPQLLPTHSGEDLVVLLLEHVEGVSGEEWKIADYAAVSRSLGQARGHLLGADTALDYGWLSEGFLRQYSSEKPVDWSLLDSEEAWQQPLVERNFPPELRAAAAWLHAARGRLYEIASALPRVLSHLDFWTKNLIRRPDGTIALIDWGFVGDGAIGEDVGNLVPDAAFDHLSTRRCFRNWRQW
jgi:Ser/Thr protein kinase RdoA (MazF antagonist)